MAAGAVEVVAEDQVCPGALTIHSRSVVVTDAIQPCPEGIVVRNAEAGIVVVEQVEIGQMSELQGERTGQAVCVEPQACEIGQVSEFRRDLTAQVVAGEGHA